MRKYGVLFVLFELEIEAPCVDEARKRISPLVMRLRSDLTPGRKKRREAYLGEGVRVVRVLADQVEGEEPGGNSWVSEEGGRWGTGSPGGVGGGEEEERGQRGGARDDRTAEVERLCGSGGGAGGGGGDGGGCHGATVVRRRRPPSGADGHLGQPVEKVNVSLGSLEIVAILPLLSFLQFKHYSQFFFKKNA